MIVSGLTIFNPNNALDYAVHIIRGRWELGEPAIATCYQSSYFYARDVIKGRWLPGEAAIATSRFYSYRYALDVLKGKFEAGHETILGSIYAERYLQLIANAEHGKALQ